MVGQSIRRAIGRGLWWFLRGVKSQPPPLRIPEDMAEYAKMLGISPRVIRPRPDDFDGAPATVGPRPSPLSGGGITFPTDPDQAVLMTGGLAAERLREERRRGQESGTSP